MPGWPSCRGNIRWTQRCHRHGYAAGLPIQSFSFLLFHTDARLLYQPYLRRPLRICRPALGPYTTISARAQSDALLRVHLTRLSCLRTASCPSPQVPHRLHHWRSITVDRHNSMQYTSHACFTLFFCFAGLCHTTGRHASAHSGLLLLAFLQRRSFFGTCLAQAPNLTPLSPQRPLALQDFVRKLSSNSSMCIAVSCKGQ